MFVNEPIPHILNYIRSLKNQLSSDDYYKVIDRLIIILNAEYNENKYPNSLIE